MMAKNRKTIATVLIILVSIILFVAFMYLNAINEKAVPEFIGIIFAIFPALAIHTIWNRKFKKHE